MADSYNEKPVFVPQSHPNGATIFAYPFLGWRARSVLAILSHPLLILLLTLITLLQARASLNGAVEDAKTSFLATCAGAEHAASLAASMPHFMASGAADAIVDGTNDVVQGVGKGLDLAVHGLEALVIFMVDTYKSMYLCLAEFVVRGSLSLLIAAAQEAEQAVTTAVQGVRTGVQDAISGAEKLLNDTIAGIDKIPGVNIQPPSLSVPALDALNNFTLPVDLSDALSKLNASLPTLDQLKGSLDDLIATPFEDLRKEINSTIANRTIAGTDLLAAVPQRQTVSFCADVDTSFIDAVGDVLQSLLKILIIVVGVAIGLVVVLCILKQRWLWRRKITQVIVARDRWLLQDNTLQPGELLSFEAHTSHPFLFGLLARLGYNTNNSPTRSRVRWLLVYLTHPTALLFLGLGILGLLAVQIQLAALGAMQNRAVAQASSGVDQVSTLVSDKIDATMQPASLAFANGSNAVLSSFSDTLNNDLFGWANTTTTHLNNTLTSFYDDLTSIVNTTFGSTPLAAPSQELLRCLIGSKVEGIQKALTFIHDNAHVSLPTVSPTLLMLSPNRTQELAASVSGTGTGTPDDPSLAEKLVAKLVEKYRKSLEAQRVGSFIMLGLYALVALLGIGAIAWDAMSARHGGVTVDAIPSGSAALPTDEAPSKRRFKDIFTRFNFRNRKATPSQFTFTMPTTVQQRGKPVSSPLDFSDRQPACELHPLLASVSKPCETRASAGARSRRQSVRHSFRRPAWNVKVTIAGFGSTQAIVLCPAAV